MSDSLREAVATRLRALVSLTRFGLFAGVGAVGAAVDNGVLFAMVEFANLGFVPAKVIAWIVAIAVIFVINERLTFAAYGTVGASALAARLFRSYQVRFAGFLVTLAVYTALVHFTGIWYILANLIGIGVGFFVNYTFESLYTWRVHHSER